MKQHITKEIVNTELNDIQRSRLKCSLEDIGGWDGSFVEDPGLSIGQMIEFLNEQDPGEWSINNTTSDGWVISSNNLYGPDYEIPSFKNLEAPYVCDALWEAVKHVLNETK